MTPVESTWNQVLSTIEKEVSRATFMTLFRPTTLVSFETNLATIATPSAILNNLLEKRFKQRLEELLQTQSGETVRVVFVVKTRPNAPTEEKDIPLFSTSQKPTLSVGHLPRVRADFTFETLAVSDSNRLAYESARNVAQHPGRSYNPLFIYGPVGVGKTHLMQAVANEVYSQNPDNKIIYITSEEFTNEVVEAIRNNDTAKMKRKFRSAQLLIIDDVQFIAGKDKVQEELFHTFNSLIDNGAQIVLSSDRPPSEIKKLEARLSSRFAGGLTVDIESPDFELRTAILLKKAEKLGFNLSIDVAKLLAEQEQDVRSLEGTLLRIITLATSAGITDITEEFAKKHLGNHLEEEHSHILHAEDVVETVCNFYNIKPTQLKGPKRNAYLVKPRQVTMYLLKKELGLTHVEIGNILGGRDHTTVMHGVEKMEALIIEKSGLSEEIVGISKMMRG